jgi:hypothetical protein
MQSCSSYFIGWLAAAMVASCAVELDGNTGAAVERELRSALECSCESDADCIGVAASCEPTAHVCLMRCPSVIIDSAADLAAARHCREVDGDFVVRSPDLEAIGASALPYLERVTGNLFSIGGKPLRELSLPALREVGTEQAPSLIEIALDTEGLRKVSLPSLTVVHGALAMFGLYALEELELPTLTRVGHNLSLVNLPRLRHLQLAPELRAGKGTQLEFLCSLPVDSVALPADGGTRNALGCCTQSALACEDTAMQCGCELRVCEDVTIETEQDLRAASTCDEIAGNLTLRARDIERITAASLPRLRRIHGSLLSLGDWPLRELTLPALEEVGSAQNNLVEIGFGQPNLERIALPRLRSVHGSFGIGAMAELRELDASALTDVSGSFGLVNLPKLSVWRHAEQLDVGGRAQLERLCELPADEVFAPEGSTERDIGCCTELPGSCEHSLCEC